MVAVSIGGIPLAGARAQVSAPPRDARSEDSRARRASRGAAAPAGGLATALLGAALVGAGFLVVTEFVTLLEVRTVTAVIEEKTGGPRHGYALVLLGVVAALMASGAFRGGSRPATLAVGAIGLAALIFALAIDLPDVTAEGVNRAFEDADAHPRIGFYLETLGGVLLLVSAVSGLLLGGSEPERTGRQSPRDRDRASGDP